MVITLNVSSNIREPKSYKLPAIDHIVKNNIACAAFHLNTTDAIADSGATQIFVMDSTTVVNKHKTTHPLKVALADGRIVLSTHMCDIKIKGLPTVLTDHIIPDLLIASLFGICILTDAGCTVTFDKNRCIVQYNGTIILNGAKDPATDLWTLPLGSPMGTTSHHVADMILPAAPVFADAWANMATQIAFFTHTVRTKANSIRFAYQSLCSPKISTLLKAIWRGYLKGCPNLTLHGVTKYLNPSPAMAKGHMKHPRQGIQSTRNPTIVQADASPHLRPPIVVNNTAHQQEPPMPLIPFARIPNVIKDDMDNQTDANLFCFAVFADKHIVTLYNDLTGTFPFMSLEGNVCFLVVYHYKSNAILALPILGFSDKIIFRAYKQIYEMIESKGFVIRFNVMDNQASKVIKKFLTPKQCD